MIREILLSVAVGTEVVVIFEMVERLLSHEERLKDLYANPKSI